MLEPTEVFVKEYDNLQYLYEKFREDNDQESTY